MALRDEIYEQPEVLRHWLDTHFEHVQEVAARIRERDVDFVFLAARGTSDHAGVYAQYVWGSRNRLPLAFAAPSLFTRYDEFPRLRHALVVGVSQSGHSPDVVRVISEARRQGAPTIALTNDPASPLGEAAEWTIEVGAGAEQAVAATKTYTAELLALAAFSAALSGDEAAGMAELRRIPDAVAAALELDGEAERIATEHAAMKHCVVLGRGYNYSTAQEWALKLKELAYVLTDVYSTADFQHGPIAIVQPDFPVLALAPSGAVFEDQLSLLRRLRDDYGANLLVLSDADEALSIGNSGLRLPAGVPEWLSPIVAIVPAQLYCYHLTRAKGYDTEQPRTLSKVTRTF